MNLLLLLALALPLLAQTANPQKPPQSLAAMQDRYRPLLIFSPDSGTPAKLSEQIELLQRHRSELLDRQVMLVPFSSGANQLPNDPAIMISLAGEEASLRLRFRVPPDAFTVILLGKDGGEKFRSHTPVTMQQLNQIVDAMPMRQQEMHTRHHP